MLLKYESFSDISCVFNVLKHVFNSPKYIKEPLAGVVRAIQNLVVLFRACPSSLNLQKTWNSGHSHIPFYCLHIFWYIEVMQLERNEEIPRALQQTSLTPFFAHLLHNSPRYEFCLCVQIIAAKRFHDWSLLL